MKKYILFVLLIAVAVLIGQAAMAEKPDQTRVLVSVGRATVAIPAKAVEVAPGIFSLGSVKQNGEVIEGYAIVHYKNKPAKPNGAECGNGICERGENARKCPKDCNGGGGEPPTEPDSSCYGFLAKGAKWKTPESYVINPANSRDLDQTFVVNNFAADVAKWETEAGVNIVENGSVTNEILVADTSAPDDKNEVYFGSIDSPGAIAITIVWGVFGGPPKNRHLVEWDQVYDDVDFDWSLSGEAGKMDFDNIATHELGHSVGMSDLYTTNCSEQTMYGYASEGETNKQTLEAGDIAGIKALYK